MSRVTNAILQPGSAHAIGVQAPMLDLTYGGQMGFSPEYAEWVSNQAYVRKNVIPILIEAPKIFQAMPNSDVLVRTLRSLIELHFLSVDGLNAGLTADFAENAFGGSGLMQHDLTNIKETPSTPNFHYIEKYGRGISRFIRMWMTYAGMDPYTKFAAINSLSTAAGITDLLADQTTATVLFIEPDPLGKKVVQSWLVANMFPKGNGDVTGSHDKTQDNQTQTVEIQFTGLHQYGAGVDVFAQRILDSISYSGANMSLRQAFIQDIAADVRAAPKSFAAGVQSLATNSLRT